MTSARMFSALLAVVLGMIGFSAGHSSADVVPTVACTPSPMAIEYGQLVECEINPAGDVDTFTFSGAAGDQIVIALLGKTLDSGPCVTLLNPAGAVVIAEQCNVFPDTHFVMIRTVLTVSGTYSVLVNEHDNNELNEYLLTVVRESPPDPTSPTGVIPAIACTPSPMAIEYGQLIQCEIDPIGDVDTFTFSGAAGDQIVIILHGRSLDSGPCATLIDPNNAVVVPEQCNVFPDTNFVMIRTLLTLSGSYAVVINEHANNELNRYLVAVLRENHTDSVLTELSPAKVWIGLKNNDDIGLRVDLRADVFLKEGPTETLVGEGELLNQSTGSSGFSNASLMTIPLGLTAGPVPVPSGAQLELRLSVRRTCSGGGHVSGTVRFWYNGAAIDTGAGRDAGSRFDATITPDASKNYFLRGGFALSTTAGTSRLSIDKFVNSSVACAGSGRPYTSFGTFTAP
jgi:Bacterial pre-peptidase C-terminal domain